MLFRSVAAATEQPALRIEVQTGHRAGMPVQAADASTIAQTPEKNVGVEAAGSEQCTFCIDRDTEHAADMPREAQPQRAGVCVAHLNGSIVTGARDLIAQSKLRHCVYRSAMRGDPMHDFAARPMPGEQPALDACRPDAVSMGAECARENGTLMGIEHRGKRSVCQGG